MPGAPETTNTLLLWLIIATALTPVLILAALLVVWVYIKRMVTEVKAVGARIEAQARPLIAEAHGTLQQVQHIAASVRRRVDEVDRGVDTIQEKTARLGDGLHQVFNGTLGRVLAILRPLSSRRAS